MAADGVSERPDPHDPPWLLSLVDHRVHAWVGLDFLTQAWEARCGHMARESQIAPDRGELRCVDCAVAEQPRLVKRFEGLADRLGAEPTVGVVATVDRQVSNVERPRSCLIGALRGPRRRRCVNRALRRQSRTDG
jgi:hypothetical protein